MWIDPNAIPGALKGQISTDDLEDIESVKQLVIKKRNTKATLSRPASLDGGLAFTEASSVAPSIPELRTPRTETFVTAREQTSRYPSQLLPPFELPATPIQELQSRLDGLPLYAGQRLQIDEYLTSSAFSSLDILNLANGSTEYAERKAATNTAQVDPFADALSSTQRKSDVYHIQDDHLKCPISPATYNFTTPSKSQLTYQHSLAAHISKLHSHSDVQTFRPSLSIAENGPFNDKGLPHVGDWVTQVSPNSPTSEVGHCRAFLVL